MNRIEWNKYMGIKVLIFLIMSPVILLKSEPQEAISQEKERTFQIFPDEYSELDDIPSPYNTEDETVILALELARMKYLQALYFEEKGDSSKASNLYSQAIDELNGLTVYPEINQNVDFIKLADNLIQDYESFMENSGNYDKNTPHFIVNNRITKKFEQDAALIGPELDLSEEELAGSQKYFGTTPGKTTIPFTDNKYTRKAIKGFSEWRFGRKFIEAVIPRANKWFPMMKKIAKEEGIPEEIVYLSVIESGLNAKIVSRASAVGLWQFMRPTGKDFGLNTDNSIWVDERRNPEKSTRAAMRYLKYLHNMFDDWHLAFAAYNSGEGRVKRAIRRSKLKNPNYWQIRKRLPKETRAYVAKYIGVATVMMNPEKYNFLLDTFQYENEYQYEIFHLNEPVNVEALANCANMTLDSFKMLNVELVKNSTPPGVNEYSLKIPVGSYNDFEKNYAELTQEEKQPWVDHKIIRYETISKISRKYGVSSAELVALNGYRSSRSKIKKGKNIKIPITAMRYEEINEAARISGTYYPMDGSQDIYHRVRSGESLYKIANKYGLSLSQLRRLNGLGRKQHRLRIGQQLIIAERDPNYVAKSSTKKKEVKEPEKLDYYKIVRHKIKSGESIEMIAEDWGMKIEDLISLNNIQGINLKTGQYLKISTNYKTKKERVVQAAPPINFAYHKVRKGETVGKIASKYNLSIRALKSDNNLNSNSIYPGQRLKIFTAKRPKKAFRNSSITSNKIHKVRRGETLYEIAKDNRISINELKRINKLKSNAIYPGQRLRMSASGNSKNLTSITNDKSTVNIQNNSSSSSKDNGTIVTHTVRKGETLGHIAENYGTRAQSIRDLNRMSGSKLNIGQKLRVRNNKKVSISNKSDISIHKVKKGETVSSIAAKHGITESQLKSWNKSKIKGNTIYANSDLKIIRSNVSKGSNPSSKKSVKTTPSYYKLRRGESFATVARKFGLSTRRLQKINPRLNPRKLQIGQEIRIK